MLRDMADLNKLSASDMQVLAEAFENISNEFKRISNVFKTNDQLEFDIDKIDDHEEENISAFDEKSISSIDNKDTKTNKDCAESVKEPDTVKKPDNFSKSDIGMSELKNDLIYGMNENSWDPKAKDISSEKVVVAESSSEQSDEQDATKNKIDTETKINKVVESGTTYEAVYKDKIYKTTRTMKIEVIGSKCKILVGSEAAAELDDKASSKIKAIYHKMVTECMDSMSKTDNNQVIFAKELKDISVAEAAYLLTGKKSNSTMFKRVDTKEAYKPSRTKTPKTSKELEKYLFNLT